jgi:hypothetical protein
MDVTQGQKWPVASNRILNLADESISQWNNYRQHNEAQQSSLPTFPQEQESHYQERGIEVGVAAGERHELVQDRADQRVVDKPKELRIGVLQPFH